MRKIKFFTLCVAVPELFPHRPGRSVRTDRMNGQPTPAYSGSDYLPMASASQELLKRQRTESTGDHTQQQSQSQPPSQDISFSQSQTSSQQQPAPKRGQRACTVCRKGKNRCEGDVSLLDSVLVHARCSLRHFAASLSSMSSQRRGMYF